MKRFILWTLLSCLGASLAAEEPRVEEKARAETKLYVRTVPEGASVNFDGQPRGASPQLIPVPQGVTRMKIEVELDGYKGQSRVVAIEGGRITRVEFELEKEAGEEPGVQQAREPTVRDRAEEFLAALASGKCAEAAEMGTRGELTPEGLAKFRDTFDLPSARIATAVAGSRDGCAVTSLFPTKDGTRKGAVGITFTREGGIWLIRDMDYLPDSPAVQKFVAQFCGRFPSADEVLAPGESDLAEAAFAAASKDVKLVVAQFVEAILRDDRGAAEKHLTKGALQELDVTEMRKRFQAGSQPGKCFADQIESVEIRGERALAATSFVEVLEPKHKGGSCLLYTLSKKGDAWHIEDIDVEDARGLAGELARLHGVPRAPLAGPFLLKRETFSVSGAGTLEFFDLDGWTRTTLGDDGATAGLSEEWKERVASMAQKVGDGAEVLAFKEGDGGTALAFVDLDFERVRNDASTVEVSRTLLRFGEGKQEGGVTLVYSGEEAVRKAMVFRTRKGSTGIIHLTREVYGKGGVNIRAKLWPASFTASKGPSPAPRRSRLDFRVAARQGDERAAAFAARPAREPGKDGPEVAAEGAEPFGWYRLRQGLDPPKDAITRKREAGLEVLLSQEEEGTLLMREGDAHPWRLIRASAVLEEDGSLGIGLQLDGEGGRRMGELTLRHVNEPLAILLDDEVLSIATIRSRITDTCMLSGRFSPEEARALEERLQTAFWSAVPEPSAGTDLPLPPPVEEGRPPK